MSSTRVWILLGVVLAIGLVVGLGSATMMRLSGGEHLVNSGEHTVASMTTSSKVPSTGASLQASESMTATITLMGLPVEDMLDAAGRLVVTNGLDNVAVGTYVLLEGGAAVHPETISAYAWTLQGPDDSVAALDDATSRHPTFIPDDVGTYVVGLAVANQQGAYGPMAYLTITAGTWVGAGIVPGGSDHPSQCIKCHEDQITTWRQTHHAASFSRAINDQISDYYLEHCIYCHTVGYADAADNDGFDDVARELGWTYPEQLVEGSWDDLVANYPRLANLGNTQCENCHGPGSQKGDGADGTAVSLRPDLCIMCHDPLRQDRYPQWLRSQHSDTSLAAFDGSEGIDDPRCAACHTAEGAIASWSGEEVVGGGMDAVTCAVCHDPHERTNEYQLRVFDTVVLPDGTQVTQVGSSALCMSCHNVVEGTEVVHEEGPFYPPQSAAAEMLTGTGGYDYGETIYDSSHAREAESTCVDCHMATQPVRARAEGDAEAVAASLNRPVGGHTFSTKWDGGTPDDPSDDVENVEVCDACHGRIPRFNGPATDDYDGNGEVGGIQDEVQGLLDLVKAEIIATGVEWKDETPHWSATGTEAQRAAIYNWSFVANDRSLGVHNFGRSVQLLQITFRHLTGQGIPGATLWENAHNTPPYAERFGSATGTLIVVLRAIGVILVVLVMVCLSIRWRKKQHRRKS